MKALVKFFDKLHLRSLLLEVRKKNEAKGKGNWMNGSSTTAVAASVTNWKRVVLSHHLSWSELYNSNDMKHIWLLLQMRSQFNHNVFHLKLNFKAFTEQYRELLLLLFLSFFILY